MKKYLLFIFDWQGTLMDDNRGDLFDGVFELLTYLKNKNVKTGIATGASRSMLNQVLELLGVGSYFDYTKTVSECRAKPDPDMINQILELSSVPKEYAIMIGDTPLDIQMARMAGIDSVGLQDDQRKKQDLVREQATYLFDNVMQFYKELSIITAKK